MDGYIYGLGDRLSLGDRSGVLVVALGLTQDMLCPATEEVHALYYGLMIIDFIPAL